MKQLKFFFFLCFFGSLFSTFAQTVARTEPGTTARLRSFDELFYNLETSQKMEVFSPYGLVYTKNANEAFTLIPTRSSGIDLIGTIMNTRPGYLAEFLIVIPNQGRTYNRLDAYNSLIKVRNLSEYKYHSHSRNTAIPLFPDATRIESINSNKAIPDPPLARVIPNSEAVYIRLRDVNFGNCYYRGDLNVSPNGISYTITNTRHLSFLLIPVIREGRFIAALYMEPIAEGMLLYSITGADTSDFIASIVDIPSAISKRLDVFTSWVREGLK